MYCASFKLGPLLPPENTISSLSVHGQIECSMHCIRKPTCVGFNFRTRSSKYTMNCQLSNNTQDIESVGSGDWVFYLVNSYPLLSVISGVASVVNWGGGGANIHIFVFTDHENNRFQKELILRNTNI